MWYRDFPCFDKQCADLDTPTVSCTTAQSDEGNLFMITLEHFLTALDCPADWLGCLRRFDFSDTQDVRDMQGNARQFYLTAFIMQVRLVASIPGRHDCKAKPFLGHHALRCIVEEWHDPSDAPDTVDYEVRLKPRVVEANVKLMSSAVLIHWVSGKLGR